MRGGLLFRGAGQSKNPRGGAGRGEKARKSTNSKILQKCEKYNITYYNINYNIIIIISAENMYSIRNRDYDHPILISIIIIIIAIHCHRD